MDIQLYGLGASRSFRCLWALHEANLDHQFHKLELGSDAAGGAQTEDYLTLNQQGKVPTLVVTDDEGQFVLTESAAILNYIDTLSDSDFIPTAARQRARYDELSFFVLAELEQPLWSNGKHRFAIPEEQRIPAMLETAVWEFAKALGALARLTSLEGYAIGDKFTFADILIAHTLNWADRFKFALDKEHLDYRDRMYARPAAQQALHAIE